MARRQATRRAQRLIAAFTGPAGGGKTYGALLLARGVVGPQGRITVIDTERARSEQYAGMEGIGDFTVDVLEPPFTPSRFVAAINAAVKAGDDLIIIDSLTHEWSGTGGVLQAVESTPGVNKYAAWKVPSAQHQSLIDAIVQCPIHVIATMRTKMAYELVEDNNGKKIPKRLGLAPVQREGAEYEFDIVIDVDQESHRARLGKCNTSYSAALAAYLEEHPVITEDTGRFLAQYVGSVETREQVHEPAVQPPTPATPPGKVGVVVVGEAERPQPEVSTGPALSPLDAKREDVLRWIDNHIASLELADTRDLLRLAATEAMDVGALKLVYDRAKEVAK